MSVVDTYAIETTDNHVQMDDEQRDEPASDETFSDFMKACGTKRKQMKKEIVCHLAAMKQKEQEIKQLQEELALHVRNLEKTERSLRDLDQIELDKLNARAEELRAKQAQRTASKSWFEESGAFLDNTMMKLKFTSP